MKSRLGQDSSAAKFETALQRHRLGQSEAAEMLYRRVLTLQPDHGGALHNLGLLFGQTGQKALAILLLARATRADPGRAIYFGNLGNAQMEDGQAVSAVISYRHALSLQRDLPGVLCSLGCALQAQGDPGAGRCYRQALALDPVHGETWYNLGVWDQDQGQLEQAASHYLKALRLRPQQARTLGNLGIVRKALGQFEAAALCQRQALAADPLLAEAYHSLGNVLHAQGDPAHASACFRCALRLRSNYAEARYHLGLCNLSLGILDAGWLGYEHRFFKVRRREFPYPEWKGEALTGKRILIWGEQGIGDELLFASLYQEVIAQAQGCVIECAPKLVPLFARNFPGAQVVAKADPPHPATQGGFDYQSACGSLARWLRPTLASFPQRERYLEAAPQRLGYWREKLAALGPGLKVGFSWRSKIMTGDRPLYCTQLAEWGPIFAVGGVHFVNLQYDDCAEELREAEARFEVKLHAFAEVDLYDDIEEAMALTQALDLVITAPNVVSVMAGALGLPTWMLSYGMLLEMLGAAQSPWFPRLRPFTRHWDRGWEAPIAETASDLRIAALNSGDASRSGR